MIIENRVSGTVIDCALKVHRALGPGLFESAYSECLRYELQKRGMVVEKQKTLPLVYDGVQLDTGYRLDMLVESRVIVEVKSVACFNDVHLAQVLTYLKLSQCKLGLLLNFNVRLMKEGIKRVVLGL